MAHDRQRIGNDIAAGTRDQSGHDALTAVGLIVHTETSPIGRVVTTAIGLLEAEAVSDFEDHLADLPVMCDALDLRYVPSIDAEGVRSVVDAHANGVASIFASPAVERVLAASGHGALVDEAPSTAPEHFHRALFGVAIHDRDLRFTYVNEAMAVIHGLPVEVHLGYRGAELLGAVDEGVTDALERVLETGFPERRHIWADAAGTVDAFDCYFGPVDIRGERGVISTVQPARRTSAPSAVELKFLRPRQPSPTNGDGAGESANFSELTVRERQVLDGIVDGLVNREIAERLFISVDTVKTHCRRLYAKLGVENRTQAAVAASVRGHRSP